jgi:protein-tyrosine phosphatase
MAGMPWIDLEGAVNVRDLGGLPTEDGGTTASGRLLRGDNLQELSPADISRLVHELGVTTVIDLRSVAELRSEGPAPLEAVAGVRHTHHPVLAEVGSATDVVADALVSRWDRDRDRYPGDPVCGHYLGYLEDRPDQVVGALRSVTAAEGAALVHCAAGKDRTGVVVALALRAVEVCPDAVIADYAATAERVEAIVARLIRSPTYAADVSGRPVSSHQPRAETMAAFLEQVEARYGGVIAWLAAHGFGPAEVQQLRDRLRSAG